MTRDGFYAVDVAYPHRLSDAAMLQRMHLLRSDCC